MYLHELTRLYMYLYIRSGLIHQAKSWYLGGIKFLDYVFFIQSKIVLFNITFGRYDNTSRFHFMPTIKITNGPGAGRRGSRVTTPTAGRRVYRQDSRSGPAVGSCQTGACVDDGRTAGAGEVVGFGASSSPLSSLGRESSRGGGSSLGGPSGVRRASGGGEGAFEAAGAAVASAGAAAGALGDGVWRAGWCGGRCARGGEGS